MLGREGKKHIATDSISQPNKYSELSILSSDDSILMRKRMAENLTRDFEQQKDYEHYF